MRIEGKSKKLIAIGGMLLLSLALVAPGSSTQSATDPPNTGMADPDALIHAFDRYVSGLLASGGTRFLNIPLGSLRALASDAIRGGLERHFGAKLAFQNCHRVAAFDFGAVGSERYQRFVSPRGQLLNQSPELRNC